MLSHLNISEDDILSINDNMLAPLTNHRTTSTFDTGTTTLPPIETETYETITDTPYNLSTMTICGRFGGTINIQYVLEHAPILPYWKLKEGCLRVEGYMDNIWSYRGVCRKYIEKPDKGQGPFKNSVTVYYRIFDEITGEAKEPSIKLFKNGGFQTTGIRTPYQAEYIVKCMRELFSITGEGTFIPSETSDTPFISVSMMNSDITIPYTIRREALQKILKDAHMRSSFESTTYQGVNIKYYWNYEKHFKGLPQSGKCECPTQCISSGKKRMMTNPELDTSGCVRITIAPFQTGKIIITGAKRIEQVDDASKWILHLIQSNSSTILSKIQTRKVYAKKSTPFRGSCIVRIPKDIPKYTVDYKETKGDDVKLLELETVDEESESE
jgi:hypothetical protein